MRKVLPLIIVILTITLGAIYQHMPKAPKIEPESKTNGIAKRSQESNGHKKHPNGPILWKNEKTEHRNADSNWQKNECQKGNSEYGMYFGSCLRTTDFFLVIFNGLLVIATFGLIITGLQEFYATHRPRLVVRRASFLDDPLRIRIAITNVGDSSARIEQSEISVQLDSREIQMHARPHYNYPSNNAAGRIKIKVGDTSHVDVPIEGVTDRTFVLKKQNRFRIALIGFLLYRNFGRIRGYTAFCRIWDSDLQEFIKPKVDERIPEYDRYEYTN
jgi:hypothetical protein